MSRRVETRAAVLYEPGTPLVVEDVLLDPPGEGEVLVRVAAAGVCHSDLHLAEGHLGGRRWPIVLGHEGAGVVESVGANVTHVGPGDHVGFCFVPACRECRYCRAGRFTLCEPAGEASWRATLLDGTTRLHLRDGSPLKHFLCVACFAEHCVVPAAAAVPLPPSLPLWQAALIGCGVVTGVGAVRNAANVRPGERVCVVGCGGVGLQVVAAARLAGAGLGVAVDRDDGKLELALGRGATHAVDGSTEDTVARVKEISEGGVDHAFEVVGLPETIRLAWDVLRPGATAVVVGLVPKRVEACVPAIEFLSEKSLKGCYYGSGDPAAELADLARLVAVGEFPLGDVVSHLTDLHGIEEAFERLRHGEGARTVAILDRELAGAPGG
jgi:S-(hydroxymethyl)glutathione dehydrogenase/alcohol dehydrogenase